MTETNEVFTRYQNNFPSTDFLSKHFGESVIIQGNPHRGEVDTDFHMGLRHLFDGVLRLAPRYILQDQKCSDSVLIFQNGVPAPWVDPALEHRGLMKVLAPEAFLELCQEFISHFQAGAFTGDEWWQWRTEGSSIWIETIVGVVRKRRTLADVLGKT